MIETTLPNVAGNVCRFCCLNKSWYNLESHSMQSVPTYQIFIFVTWRISQILHCRSNCQTISNIISFPLFQVVAQAQSSRGGRRPPEPSIYRPAPLPSSSTRPWLLRTGSHKCKTTNFTSFATLKSTSGWYGCCCCLLCIHKSITKSVKAFVKLFLNW